MKTKVKFIIFLLGAMIGFLGVIVNTYALDTIDNNVDIFTQDKSDVVSDLDGGNAMKAGVENIGDHIQGIKASTGEGKYETIYLIRDVVNYFISILALVATLYILYGGFQAITAGGEDKKYQAGFNAIKTGFIAILGIGFSWLMVGFILSFVNKAEGTGVSSGFFMLK